MRKRLFAMAVWAVLAPSAFAQTGTIWDRRDYNMAHMFDDLRARRVGDVLTIVIDEVTGSDAQEKREMNKTTDTGLTATGSGSASSLGKVLSSFSADLDLSAGSKRKFDGKANSTIDRKFSDKLTVIVAAVLPNGNLVVEGYRQRVVTREMRTLRIMGVVRPADIGPFNTVQSQYIANLFVSYAGRGPESAYTNQNYGGRIFNKLWPF